MLFDHHIAVDWSANGSPKRGKDSIWISEDGARGVNPPTRAEAMELIRERIDRALEAGERLHVGFDFAFGLTRGAGERLLGVGCWRAFWAFLHAEVEEGPRNASNRFEVGQRLNARADADGPFWGHPWQHSYEGLRPIRCAKGGQAWPHPFPDRRHCDARQRGAQEIWKLAYTGSVGSQMLLGVAALESLRQEFAEVAIWPFETRFGEKLDAPVLITEIYPSARMWDYHSLLDGASVVDEAQVMAVSGICLKEDREGRFREWLEPRDANAEEREDAIREEGWILGL